MTAFQPGAATDTGRVREGNEDFLLADRAAGVFVVADGMGGHRGGEIASHLAVKTLEQRLRSNKRLTTDMVVAAVQEANEALVTRASEDPDLRGMGTTLCALVLVNSDEEEELLGLVNVGDSRVYLLKDGELEQITEDHSLVATLERQGRLSKAEAAVHPQRNILTRALGIDSKVMVDSWEIRPIVGDRYLLCSDGLFNEVDDSRIAATLRRLADPDEAAKELVRLANEGGGRDNITVVVVDIIEGERAGGGSDRIVSSAHTGERVLEVDGEPPDSTMQQPALDGQGDGGGSTAAVGARPPVPPPAPTAAKSPKRRLVTWRVVLFFVVALGIVGVAAGFVYYNATQPYFVGFSPSGQDPATDRVGIFQGQPGGLVGIEPELRDDQYGITRADVREFAPDEEAKLDAGIDQESHSAAERYIHNLETTIRRTRNQRQIEQGQTPVPPDQETTTTLASPNPFDTGAGN